MKVLVRTFTWARGWVSAARLFLNPSRLEMVFEMDRAFSEEKATAARIALLRDDEIARAALDARRRLVVDVDALSTMATGTLGRELAEFLRRNGLDPRSIPRLPATTDAEYVSAHLYETH